MFEQKQECVIEHKLSPVGYHLVEMSLSVVYVW